MSITNYPGGVSSFGGAMGGVTALGGTYRVVKAAPQGELLGSHLTIQSALNVSKTGDVILICPGEYNEDLTLTDGQVTLVGAGPRHSVRVTGTAAGTATALTLAGVSDVNLVNLNLEGRSGGAGLVTSGQIRRLAVIGCKLHGGTNACALVAASGGQFVDVRFEDCVFANATNGLNISYTGGDPGHQILVDGCLFQKIVTDCIVENGATHDITVRNSTFAANDGTAPTQFIDLDTTGTTGLVVGNTFHAAAHASATIALATGVFYAGNFTEEGVNTARPD
jgi:hypothetical protein